MSIMMTKMGARPPVFQVSALRPKVSGAEALACGSDKGLRMQVEVDLEPLDDAPRWYDARKVAVTAG